MPSLFRRRRPGSPDPGVTDEENDRRTDESRRHAQNAARVEASERAARDQAIGNEQRRRASDAEARRQSDENEERRQASDAETRRRTDENKARYRLQDGSSDTGDADRR